MLDALLLLRSKKRFCSPLVKASCNIYVIGFYTALYLWQTVVLLDLCIYTHTSLEHGSTRIREKTTWTFLFWVFVFVLSFYLVIEIGLNSSSPVVVFFMVLKFITVSRCILGNGRRGNLEHRRRGGESVLRKACDTRASTCCQTVFSSSSLPFVVCSSNFIVIYLICNCEYINFNFSVLVSMIIITPIFYLTDNTWIMK